MPYLVGISYCWKPMIIPKFQDGNEHQSTIFAHSYAIKENQCFRISKLRMSSNPLIVSIMTFIISHFTCVYIFEGATHNNDWDTGGRIMWSTHEILTAFSILRSRSFYSLLNLYIIVTDYPVFGYYNWISRDFIQALIQHLPV